MDIEKLKTN